MTILLRSLRLIALATWVGALVFFGFVASIAFNTLHDPRQAGEIVRTALTTLHRLGFAAGILYLILTLALLATQRDTHPIRAAELALVIAMLALTAYSQFSVIPTMEADRLSANGDINTLPATAPAHQRFDRLHNLSVKLEGAILIEGILLLITATIHGRDDFDRFA